MDELIDRLVRDDDAWKPNVGLVLTDFLAHKLSVRERTTSIQTDKGLRNMPTCRCKTRFLPHTTTGEEGGGSRDGGVAPPCRRLPGGDGGAALTEEARRRRGRRGGVLTRQREAAPDAAGAPARREERYEGSPKKQAEDRRDEDLLQVFSRQGSEVNTWGAPTTVLDPAWANARPCADSCGTNGSRSPR